MNNDDFQVFSCKGSLFERWKVLCVIYGVCRRENRNALPLILLFVPVYSAYFVPLRNDPFISKLVKDSKDTIKKKTTQILGVFFESGN